MSRDPDAPKHSQPPRAAEPRAERRRAPRWNAHVPVFVYGHMGDDEPFCEEAYSAVVSDRGALLIMATTVPVGAKLLVTNKVTQIDQKCRVAGIGRRDGPSIEIAIEFTGRTEQFWRITPGPQRAPSVESTELRRKVL
jgi:hypothetical protein